jgi:membrane associated rhomboid family serine protease
LRCLICQNIDMDLESQLSIDQQRWLVIPSQLEDGLTTRPLSKRQLRNWSLVLQACEIPCQSQRLDHGWQLLVPREHYQAALSELRDYERENRNWPPPLPEQPIQQENTATTIWVLIALGLFHILTQKQLNLFGQQPINWYELGNAHAGKILAGEWWRTVTALTLHSGGVHLASNIIIGGVFINRLCRDLGSGPGWSLVLLSGTLGNLANALAQNPEHRSIGASTAVFGAVGLLAAINTMRYRASLRHRWPIPVAAALGLLALLGAGGENTDIGAHLFGFLWGTALGLAHEHFTRWDISTHSLARMLPYIFSCSLIILAWALALSSH